MPHDAAMAAAAAACCMHDDDAMISVQCTILGHYASIAAGFLSRTQIVESFVENLARVLEKMKNDGCVDPTHHPHPLMGSWIIIHHRRVIHHVLDQEGRGEERVVRMGKGVRVGVWLFLKKIVRYRV